MTNTKTTLPAPVAPLSFDETAEQFRITIKHGRNMNRASTKAFAALCKCAFSQNNEKDMCSMLARAINIVHTEKQTNAMVSKLETRMKKIYEIEFRLTVKLSKGAFVVTVNPDTATYAEVKRFVSTRDGNKFSLWDAGENELAYNAKKTAERKAKAEAKKAEKEEAKAKAEQANAEAEADPTIQACEEEMRKLYLTIQNKSKDGKQALDAFKALNRFVAQYFEQSK